MEYNNTAKQIMAAVHIHYRCKQYCRSFKDCKFGEGNNTPFGCCKCPAEDFAQGFVVGMMAYAEALSESLNKCTDRNESKK